jgi:hypothetical protein
MVGMAFIVKMVALVPSDPLSSVMDSSKDSFILPSFPFLHLLLVVAFAFLPSFATAWDSATVEASFLPYPYPSQAITIEELEQAIAREQEQVAFTSL